MPKLIFLIFTFKMKLLDYVWFTFKAQAVGIVLVETDEGKKSYIGVGDGLHEESDLDMIQNWGARFPIEAAEKLFPAYFQ